VVWGGRGVHFNANPAGICAGAVTPSLSLAI
jgi:hypothetical protein